MLPIGLIFKWINVAIVLSGVAYYCISTLLPALQMRIYDQIKRQSERLSRLASFKEQRLLVNASIDQQKIVIDQLFLKIDRWNSYEMEIKKKSQSFHSAVYHDAKKRIDQQAHFLQQHKTLLYSVDVLINDIKEKLCTMMDHKQQDEYIKTIINRVKKENHGLQ